MGLLTVKEIQNARVESNKKWRIMSDGGGLYLRVGRPPQFRAGEASKYWLAKMTFKGNRVEIGLGRFPDLSLAEAREQNETMRVMARQGKDPRRRKMTDNGNGTPTFAEAVDEYLEAKLDQFSNAKHRQQWGNTLKEYAVKPKRASGLGRMKVDAIETDDVLRVLKPIWRTKTETAARLRGRIEKVLDWATTMKFRAGDNPARWKGNLEHLLPNPAKLKNVEHHAALEVKDLPAFWADLAKREGMGALVLRLVALTGTRSSEARGAQWDEFDLEAGVWTIPAARMKMRKDHVLALSGAALDVLQQVKGLHSENVFPSPHGEPKPLSEASVRKVLTGMGYKDRSGKPITTHGFRATLRMWMQEQGVEHDLGETILAHSVGNAATQAYARSKMVERQREVLERYAEYAVSEIGESKP